MLCVPFSKKNPRWGPGIFVLYVYQPVKYGGIKNAKLSRYIKISSGKIHLSHRPKLMRAKPMAAIVTGSVGIEILSQLPPN